MELVNYKIIVDYAYEELQKQLGAKNSHPDKYKKALTDWKRAKRMFINKMNESISTMSGAGMGKDYINFDIPNNLKESEENNSNGE
jgi:hypothetical protein